MREAKTIRSRSEVLNREDSVKARLRQKFLQYAKKLRKNKETKEVANRITKNIDKLVEWYIINKRDMNLKEFEKILGIEES